MSFASVWQDDGVLVRSADVNGFTLRELHFPPGYAHATFDPERAYVAVVLEGAVEKSFPRRTMQFAATAAVTIPVGAAHSARVGREGARILTVVSKGAGAVDRVVGLPAGEVGWLAWRLAAELRATDGAASLAAEGLSLELLAAAARHGERPAARTPPWLLAIEEVLRTRIGEHVGLSELAGAVGVHPTHVARTFRARFGMSVGEYARRLRLEWAAGELARGDAPIATIAARAGFADQSHFTRLFRRYVGTTPAAYRRELQARDVPV